MEALEVCMKRSAHKLSLKRRFERLTADDVVRSQRMKKMLYIILITIRRKEKGRKDKQIRLRKLLKASFARYLQVVYYAPKPLRPPRRLDRTIGSFSNQDCPLFFRFTKPHLRELYELLGFKALDDNDEDEGIVSFDNHERMGREEIMLRALYELASGETQHKISSNVFGRDQPSQSRALSWFMTYVFETCGHKVTDNLQWWFDNGFFASSAQAIHEKLDLGEDTPKNMVSHFIDCNCLETERVGGGPAEAGANAARWDPTIQRAFYNGWKSCNGLKHQTVDDAYGFSISVYGPYSLRRNDLTLLRESDVNNSFARMQLAENEDYIIFGDSAYKLQSHLRSYFTAAEGIPGYDRWNRHMKRLRISIEWNYGHQASLFKYLISSGKLKLLGSENVSRVFIVTALLRNLHTGFYGSQSSQYFNLPIPPNFNYCYMKGLPLQSLE